MLWFWLFGGCVGCCGDCLRLVVVIRFRVLCVLAVFPFVCFWFAWYV